MGEGVCVSASMWEREYVGEGVCWNWSMCEWEYKGMGVVVFGSWSM